VVAVALAGSLLGLRNDFAQDDLFLVRDNPRVNGQGDWRELLTSPWWPPPWHQGLYRPLTSLLLAAQFAVGGGQPLLFRATSYALYAAVSVTVYLLAARLLPRGVALAISLVFAAHPLHVEAVALAVGQGELIIALAAAIMTARYLELRGRERSRPGDWAALALLYFLGSMAKEQGLLLPGLLLAAEAFLVPGPIRPRAGELATGYGALAAVAILVISVRFTVLGGEFAGDFTAEALQGLTIGERALTMLTVVPQWARLLLWPAHLQIDYSPEEMTATNRLEPAGTLGLVLLLGAVATLCLARRRAPVVSFGLAWCAVALAPVSNVLMPTGILLAERTLFLASVGLLLAAGGMVDLMGRGWGWGRSRIGSSMLIRRGLAGVGAAVLAAGVIRSAARHRDWRNDPFFAVVSVQDAPRSYRTQRTYGDVLFSLRQRRLALEAYDRAITLAPAGNVWRVRNDLARQLRARGESALEVEQLAASLAEVPDQEDTRGYLVAAYLSLGDYAAAAREADAGLAWRGNPEVFGGLRALADSAARVAAPAGSIRIRINTGPRRADRPAP
jgi:hypothetical protein